MANYLYNGVELPALPTVDGYPYALIFHQDSENDENDFCYLCLCNSPVKKDATKLSAVESSSMALMRYDLDGGAWGEGKAVDYNGWFGVGQVDVLLWTSHAIYYADDYYDSALAGTLYLAASEPIPVGGEPIDPTSFIQGWLVGSRLAGMRK